MSEEKTIYTITSGRNEHVFIHAMPGHFVSSSSHLNFYIGTSDIKHNHDVSVDAAMMLASYYHERGIEVDTVLCLYETQALGAYLAHELQRANMLNPNPDSTVYVLGLNMTLRVISFSVIIFVSLLTVKEFYFLFLVSQAVKLLKEQWKALIITAAKQSEFLLFSLQLMRLTE